MAITEREKAQVLEIKHNVIALSTNELIDYAHRPALTKDQARFQLAEAAVLAFWAHEAIADDPDREQDSDTFKDIEHALLDEYQKRGLAEVIDFGAAALRKKTKSSLHYHAF